MLRSTSKRGSVRPSVGPLRLLIYPLIEVFGSTLGRVAGLVSSQSPVTSTAVVVHQSKARAAVFLYQLEQKNCIAKDQRRSEPERGKKGENKRKRER